MGSETAKTRRRPRSDSLRNREKLLEAATEIFSAGDPQASLEGVARQAGVGIGTLYRHFPTRESLFEAVYRQEVDQLAELAEQLAGCDDPVAAIRQWLHAVVRLSSTKKGMIAALQIVASASTDLKAYTSARMEDAMARLVDRAVVAQAIREDIAPADLLRAAFGVIYSQSTEGWQTTALRLVDILVDGLAKSDTQRRDQAK